MKGQLVRAADVVAIGPLMIYFGVQARGIALPLRTAMVVFGVGTIVYNAANYLAVEQQKKAGRDHD